MHVGQLTIQQHGNGTNNKTAVRQDGGLKKKRRRIYWRGIMEKTKQIKYHVCDFCGKECKSTSQYNLPQFELFPSFESYGKWRIVSKQMDVCEECEDQIVGMLDKFQERMKDNDLLSGTTVQPDAAGQNQESSDNSEE